MTRPDAGSTGSDDLESLVAAVGDPRRWTWVFDFDGTLAPIVDHPDDAAPAPGAWEAVAALAEVCPVALLSGRSLDDLAACLVTVPDHVLLIGGHGSEARTPDGTRLALTDLEAATHALDDVTDQLEVLLDTDAGWLVERKVTSVAVHHRRVAPPERERLLPRVRATLEDVAPREPGFVILTGKAVLELKVAGVDKGRAVRWIGEAAAHHAVDHHAVDHHAGGRPEVSAVRPLVLGDDVTDEDAFEEALVCGGEAVLIADAPVATTARFRLRDPDRVVTLLQAVRDGLGPRPTPGPGTRWEGTEWDSRP